MILINVSKMNSIVPIEFLQPLLIFLVLVTLVIFIFIFLKKPINEQIRRYKLLNKLPGPKRYPILGNLFEISTNDGKQIYKKHFLPKNIASLVTIFNKQRKWSREYSPVYAIMAYPYCLVNFTQPEDIEVSKLL